METRSHDPAFSELHIYKEPDSDHWSVISKDGLFVSHGLAFDELLGLVAALVIPPGWEKHLTTTPDILAAHIDWRAQRRREQANQNKGNST